MNRHNATLCIIFTILAGTPSCVISADEATIEGSHWIVAQPIIRTTSELMELAQKKRLQNQHRPFVRPRTADYRKATHKPIPDVPEVTEPDPLTMDISIQKIPSSPAQNVGLNFTAATVGNVLDPYIIPPNLNGWVGPTQYILMTYQIIRSFNKTTGNPDGILDIDASSFFGISANDVRIEYDRFSQRWLMSCEDINESTGQVPNLILVMSNSSVITPSTLWYFYTITNAQVMPQIRPLGSGDLDYQQLAVDKNNIYISVDTFDKYGYFVGSSVVVIPKSSITQTSLVSKVIYGLLRSSQFVTPADNFDTSPTFGYLINALNYVYPSNKTYSKLYFYRIINPGKANQSLSSLITITVPYYTDPANAPYKGNVFGSSTFLQTSGCSLMAGHIRNHQLYVCHNIQVNRTGIGKPTGDRVGVRWYQFDLTGDRTGQGKGSERSTTVPVLIQSGTLFDTFVSNPKFYYIPSIMTNKNGDLVIAGTVSSTQTAPNVFYAGRKAADARGTLRPSSLLTNSTYSYNFGPFVDPTNANIGQRWGDASSLSPDPVYDLDMWATQEFAAVLNGWGVQVTQLQPAV